MPNIRLSESFVFAKSNGNKIKKTDLAKILWGKSTTKTAHTNLCNLASGRVKKIDIKAIPIICKELGVTSDYLFGLAEYPTRGEEFDALRNKIVELIMKMEDSTKELKETL